MLRHLLDNRPAFLADGFDSDALQLFLHGRLHLLLFFLGRARETFFQLLELRRSIR